MHWKSQNGQKIPCCADYGWLKPNSLNCGEIRMDYGWPKPNSLNYREICRLKKIHEFFYERFDR